MSFIEVNSPVLTAVGQDRRVILHWHVNSTTGIKGYTVHRDYNAVAKLTPDATSYTNFELSSDTAYVYHLVAEAHSGFVSTVSNIVDVRTIKISRPSAPREFNVILDSDDNRALISWTTPVIYGGSDYIIYDYSILILYNKGKDRLISENHTKRMNLTINNLPDVSSYDIRVRANNGVYVSNWVLAYYGDISTD